MQFLQARIFGIPVLWIVVGVGGLALGIWFLRSKSSGSSNSAYNANGVPSDPQLDPITGVPWAVEEAINPATGLPAYYGSGTNAASAPTPPPTSSPSSGLPSNGGAPLPPPAPPVPTPAPPPGTSPIPPMPPAPGAPGNITGAGAGSPPGGGNKTWNNGPPTMAGPAAMARPRRTVTAQAWPSPLSSLHAIWQRNGAGMSYPTWERHVLAMNPQIKDPGRLYPNERIAIP